MKTSCLFWFLLLLCISASAQFNPAWKGKKCAVVLTYDDALNVHLDHAIPVLDSLQLKATFYLTASSPGCKLRLDDWRKAAAKGYELGNHTLFHPCIGNKSGREWVKPDYNLNSYTPQRMIDETRMNNVFLEALDGKKQRTFAFTCGDMTAGGIPFFNELKKDFTAARAVRHQMHRIQQVDVYNVDCYAINGESGNDLIQLVRQARDSGSLLVFLFHGVGGEHSLNVSLGAHSELLHFLKQNEQDIWTATMLEAAEHVKEWQFRDSVRIATQLATQEDYKKMLALLKIQKTRPGPSGNPQAPNAANTDESKATTYTHLPDPLQLNNGRKVKSAKTWWTKRRPELVESFDREIYGRMPANTPKVKWELMYKTDSTINGLACTVKNLIGRVDNSIYPSIQVNIQLAVVTPAAKISPVPLMMEFGFVFPPGFRLPAPPATAVVEPGWQEQLLRQGWGYAILVPTSFQEDNGAGLTRGIIGLVNKGQPRKPDDWGTLRAWAWGASRALDYFETDPAVDSKRIGIEGLSRYGKAAIVAMAYESRFAIGFIGSSGAGGTKILRRTLGEQIENLASSGEYHWFAGNFIKYISQLTAADLPVDAHELIALCAPRPVFISSGSPQVEGQWVDAKGMFLGGAHAGKVYELLGKKGLGTMDFPPIETALTDGEIAFRQHKGGHTTGPNWAYFIPFARRYFE